MKKNMIMLAIACFTLSGTTLNAATIKGKPPEKDSLTQSSPQQEIEEETPQNDPLNAVVRIEAVSTVPSYALPWQNLMPQSCSGSGVVIVGNHILTNAHNIADSTLITVRKQNEDTLFVAKVKFVDHECDLALLSIDDPNFFTDITPMEFAETPPPQSMVIAAGFPMGGDGLSLTQGIISRIEVREYAHSDKDLLTAQIDASINPGITPNVFEGTFPAESLSSIMPVIVSGKKSKAAYLYKSQEITSSKFPIVLDGDTPAGTELLDKIAEYQSQAEVVLSNFAQNENSKKIVGNFRALAGLHPQIIDDLQNTFIGTENSDEEQDLKWLRRLPKAELHCHFGGILSPSEMITVARTEIDMVQSLMKEYPVFKDYLNEIKGYVQAGSSIDLRKKIRDKKRIRKPFAFIPEPYGICGFLQQFEGKADLLDQVIFNDYIDSEVYQGIGIESYEKLGDLQGSALMQSENCIRKACQILLDQCRKNNTSYLELRCSPMNYTRGQLTGPDVVRILLGELSGQTDVYVTLLFIASRHGKMSDIYRHIELADELFTHHEGWTEEYADCFRERFVGFDLAGAETVRSPKELREAFETLHKRCLNLTIHAGETADAESIWEAVYYLNADRIGHGLKLLEQPDLLNRFVDHRIAIEMCPSSNFQICGFWDRTVPNSNKRPLYPLPQYLQQGLRVTINTDNPGISRTDFSIEYLKAARMSPSGISKWDILQLINNSFTVTFAPFQIRRKIILDVEQMIMKQIEVDYGA